MNRLLGYLFKGIPLERVQWKNNGEDQEISIVFERLGRSGVLCRLLEKEKIDIGIGGSNRTCTVKRVDIEKALSGNKDQSGATEYKIYNSTNQIYFQPDVFQNSDLLSMREKALLLKGVEFLDTPEKAAEIAINHQEQIAQIQAQIEFVFLVYQKLHMYRCGCTDQEYGNLGINLPNLSVR